MKKFFVVGCPRSGTTMVQQALNRHSQIAIPPETKFFFSFLGHSHPAQKRHVERLNADLGVRLTLPAGGVRTDPEARAFYDQMAGQYVEKLGKPGASQFGEKTPEHTGHLGRIRALFPDAKIVVLYRDGRDVALSLAKTPWAPKNVYANFVIWLYYQSIVLRIRTRPDPNIHFVRYEDVVADPDVAFHDVLSFLGLPYEDRVAEGCGNRDGIPAREYLWKANALQKITPERVGTFRRELSTDEIAILERLGRQTLTEFGYPLETDGTRSLSPGFALKLTAALTRFLARVPWYSAARELLARLQTEIHGPVARPGALIVGH
ncbi:sulfotransferase family protein [Frigoriglobus tundricola]|uniref:Sulfotransferase n=1 Tax=Frigoriglobus tundricola TaxID=2774151 RepID=A0A6M5YSY7_9BACT|nr:sulfotransferase [Frigoriglobus tundricola]QJW96401.1 hypothetical protein FTUN_3958 [Frigoriglobus tundricola]